MTKLRQPMMADMKLHGLAPGTQKVYLNAVGHLAGHYRRSPDQLSEQQLRDYFTYLVEEKRVLSSTLRTEIFGVIQGLLGHRSLKTTTLYLHMTQSVMQSVQDAVNDLTADL